MKKVLVVCSGNHSGVASFILEQANSLMSIGIVVDFFYVSQKGIKGYLKSLKLLKEKIAVFNPEIVHAHYGLSGLLSNLQRKVPVVTTYHGSDINIPQIRFFSKISIFLSAHNIFVAEKLWKVAGSPKKSSIIPCGVDTSIFKPMDRIEARKYFNLDNNARLIMFSGSFDNQVKNYDLAKNAVSKLKNVQLIELKGFSREEVALLFNAVDVALMTSISEGSPQFIKEALACNCPVVSVNVGDVPEMISDVNNSFIVNYDEGEIAEKLDIVLKSQQRSNGRAIILNKNLALSDVAAQLIEIYKQIIHK